MSRRHVVALGAVLIAALLGGCTSGQNSQPEESQAATTPAPSATPVPLSHQTSFNVTLGAEGTKGTYQVTYNYGDLTAYKPGSLAQIPGAHAAMNDTVLGSACQLREGERAIPFAFSTRGVTDGVGMVRVWLMPVLNKEGKELGPPQGTVRLEYSGFQGGAQCNKNATNGTPTTYGFYGPASTHFASWITGWVILSGEALDGTYDLAVMSSAFNSGVSDNTVTEVKGGKPYATQLANGQGRTVAGSVVPLVPGK